MPSQAVVPTFELLPRVANAPPWIRKAKDPKFKKSDIRTLKFVDDQVNLNKINMRKAELLVQNGNFFRNVRDKRTEDLLEHITTRAELKGMRINEKKTSLMCVSAATSFEARATVNVKQERVLGSQHLKILGVTLDSNCTFGSHINNLSKKMRAKTWALTKLRKAGLPEDRLVRAYKGLIRPTVEYAVPAWGSMVTAQQAALLEKQQVQALKNIFGPGLSAQKLRKKADIDLLSKRRRANCLSFAKKNIMNERCRDWFVKRPMPNYARRSTTNYPEYEIPFARTDRFKNSPKNYLISLLNSETTRRLTQ